jgi:hypothetical protein
LSRLLIDEPPLQVLPSLAKAIGLEEAIVLQQIHYRMRLRSADANEWVQISITTLLEWCPFLSRRSMERITASLKSQGLIEVAQRSGFDRTNWLRVRYEAIAAIPPNGGIDTAKTVVSDTANLAGSHTANLAGSLIQESISKKREREEPRKRGTRRCPDSFEVTDEMRAWAARECPGVNVLAATAKFKDHEFAVARSDWPACWRNWMRKEKPSEPVKVKRQPTPEEIEAARLAAIAANRAEMRRLGQQ